MHYDRLATRFRKGLILVVHCGPLKTVYRIGQMENCVTPESGLRYRVRRHQRNRSREQENKRCPTDEGTIPRDTQAHTYRYYASLREEQPGPWTHADTSRSSEDQQMRRHDPNKLAKFSDLIFQLKFFLFECFLPGSFLYGLYLVAKYELRLY
jgi:hypothetical protein